MKGINCQYLNVGYTIKKKIHLDQIASIGKFGCYLQIGNLLGVICSEKLKIDGFHFW